MVGFARSSNERKGWQRTKCLTDVAGQPAQLISILLFLLNDRSLYTQL